MSDLMKPMSVNKIIEWMLSEYKKTGSIFGVHKLYKSDEKNNRTIFGRTIETPVGPAAGPHTQLSQNIISAYISGSRFFELKTVQKMDGRELASCVNKPCISAEDEGYNVEWSTELYVEQAMEEYIKAWCILKVISKEFGLGKTDGFQFNMSVGYDLEGIKSEKINNFIESMKSATNTRIFNECKEYFLNNLNKFSNITKEDIENISSDICNSVTISTLHGCPPHEIERIATYLMKEKQLNTFIKCNPTLLGYEFARNTMDSLGYEYLSFGDFHFNDDLQYNDAVPMLKRLMKLADELNLEFGVKISNTFPVDIKNNELPAEEMYMSGRALYPLSISLASKLSEEFEGKLRISYSGGVDYHNVCQIIETGILPVTLATTLLKPGGYKRLYQIADLANNIKVNSPYIDVNKIKKLANDALIDTYYKKPSKTLPSRKTNKQVPIINCFLSPCSEGCPINQDITTYMALVAENRFEEALQVITEKNPLPFITGTICPHKCMSKCTRNFYDSPIEIRKAKLIAAENAKITVNIDENEHAGKTAVIGGGPAGLSAAYFLAKNGSKVTIFEKENKLGGVVRNIIPEFRISVDSVEKDIDFILSLGIDVKLNTRINSIKELMEDGYDNIIIATGAQVQEKVDLEGCNIVNAIEFLKDYKENKIKDIGKNVVIIGGGNTAMDTARAAKRINGVEEVSIVYRRTKKYMPAEEEELNLAIEEGVIFRELLSPEKAEDGNLKCFVMELTKTDLTGRAGIKKTDASVYIPCDTAIFAVGENVDTDFYINNDIKIDMNGKAVINQDTKESSVNGVYIVGDASAGPATVVEGIRDALLSTSHILGKPVFKDKYFDKTTENEIYEQRGILGESSCLHCAVICESCTEVCPNRANVSIIVPNLKQHQIIHVDSMCNECGNCKTFCPYDSAPYKDKFTLFSDEEDMKDSTNQGFTVLNADKSIVKLRYNNKEFIYEYGDKNDFVPEEIGCLIKEICNNYNYLFI